MKRDTARKRGWNRSMGQMRCDKRNKKIIMKRNKHRSVKNFIFNV